MINAKKLANKSRKSILEMIYSSKASHIGSSLSVVDIIASIYTFKINNQRVNDVILISKGHAAAAVYAVLGNIGVIPEEKLKTYCEDGSSLGGHVTHYDNPGVEFSTGSLGHALSFAVGKSLARIKNNQDSKIFVVLSDGECNEGSIWEAALLAAHNNLSNLIVIIDRNYLQSLKSTEETVKLEPLNKKWEAFGWTVSNIDGHDHEEIIRQLQENDIAQSSPKLIIANTIKGKGVSFMENQVKWHYLSPNNDQLTLAREELGNNFEK
jgi:transketolase